MDELGSATLSSASPAVEITVAVVDASYVLATPGVNAPNVAGAPSVSDSVAGTVPVTGAVTGGDDRVDGSDLGLRVRARELGGDFRGADDVSGQVTSGVAVSLNESRPRAISVP